MMTNAILDNDFINELLRQTSHEIFARITILTQKEDPIEFIEGKVTGGSINVDGNSVIRRTCSLSLVSNNIKINEFYWGLKNKFKLEIGLINEFNPRYEDIIWFPQGIFLITNFDTNLTTKNCTISIKGKDKMCLLNGEFGGHLPHATDFGKEEYYDVNTDTVTYTDIPIRTIVREAVRNFGDELPHNIIINDIEDAGLELLEYRGNTPMYMFRKEQEDLFTNMTFNGKQTCFYETENGALIKSTIDDEEHIYYDNLVDLAGENSPTRVRLHELVDQYYYIAKFEYGSIPGYRLTDLTYAGDLISNAGDTVVSLLDKVKDMLGDFEYFYNLDGKFVFQRKKQYQAYNWQGSEIDEVLYSDATLNMDKPIFNLLDNKLISSFKNSPKISELRNDYSIWGNKRSTSGAENPIHARYAIDIKPKYYKAYDGTIYCSDKDLLNEDAKFVDWREIIYQMALDYRRYYHDDDFLYQVGQNNINYYPTGQTGYERYYVDLEGFWRTLYNPDPEPLYESIPYTEAPQYYRDDSLYLQNTYRKLEMKEQDELLVDIEKLYLLDYVRDPNHPDIVPFLGSQYCKLEEDRESEDYDLYFFVDEDNVMNNGTNNKYELNKVNLADIYLKNRGPYIVNGDYLNVVELTANTYRPGIYYTKIRDARRTQYFGNFNSGLQYYLEKSGGWPISVGLEVYEPYKYYKFNGKNYYLATENNFDKDAIYYKNGFADYTVVNLNSNTYKPYTYYLTRTVQNVFGETTTEYYLCKDSLFDKNKTYYKATNIHYIRFVLGEYKFKTGVYYIDEPSTYRLSEDEFNSNETYYSYKYHSQHYYVKGPDLPSEYDEEESKYQFWVFKYPFGTPVGKYVNDYTSFAARKLEKYLDKYGWDNLYIKTEGHVKFSNLDLDIQRLYYKSRNQIVADENGNETLVPELTQYLFNPIYDNYNIMKTNKSMVSYNIYNIFPENYNQDIDKFTNAILEAQKEIIGEKQTGITDNGEVIYEPYINDTMKEILNSMLDIEKRNYEDDDEFKEMLRKNYDLYLQELSKLCSTFINDIVLSSEFVHYKYGYYDFNRNFDTGDFWTKTITNSPEDLVFWFDFINGETSNLSKYSVQAIGPRTKVVNDKDVKSIFYKEVPQSIFITSKEEKDKYEYQTGYTYIQLTPGMESLFSISTKGKSAKETLDDLLYTHTYAAETATIQTVPIYHLQPNACIYIRNDESDIDGEYIVSKITVPLDHKKMMSITATEVVPSII